jgi:hypothetical protein
MAQYSLREKKHNPLAPFIKGEQLFAFVPYIKGTQGLGTEGLCRYVTLFLCLYN